MKRYAADTSVPVERSRAELDRHLKQAGAKNIVFGEGEQLAFVMFQIGEHVYRVTLPLPDRNEKRFWSTPKRHFRRTPDEAFKEWEQACRASWRALCLFIKGDLEAAALGIVKLEEAMMSFVVVPGADGRPSTLGREILPRLAELQSGSTSIAGLLGFDHGDQK